MNGRLPRNLIGILGFLIPGILITMLAHGQQAPDWSVTASSYFGGSGQSDAVVGAVIQEDGTLVLAANLDDLVPMALESRTLGFGGNGAVVRLAPDGQSILSVTRLAEVVYDLAADGEGNLYVAAGDQGVLSLDPRAETLRWTDLEGTGVWRVDAGTEGHAVALVPDAMANKAGNGTIHLLAPDGTHLTQFAGYANTMDVSIDERTGTVIYVGWRNLKVYNGTYSRSYNGTTRTPVDVPYIRGVPFDYGQPDGGDRKWILHGWEADVWLDAGQTQPNPRYINFPFSTDPDNLYTQAEIDALEADSSYDYSYLLGNPKSIRNNMADTRAYRCTVGQDGQLYVGFEADGGNTPLRFDPFDLAEDAPWNSIDGFFDNFYATSTVPKLVVSRYRLQEKTAVWQHTYGFTNRLTMKPGESANDNTISIREGDVTADEEGRVYLTGQCYAGFYLPDNPAPDFSIPLAGETVFEPFAIHPYTGGSFLMVLSPDFNKRLFSTRTAGGGGLALAARTLDTDGTPTVLWGGQTGSKPTNIINRVYLRNALQPYRMGTNWITVDENTELSAFDANTDSDGWFSFVSGEGAVIRALAETQHSYIEGEEVVLDGSRSFSRDGRIVSWQWRDLGTGSLLSRDETARLPFPAGGYTVRLTVGDDLGNEHSTMLRFDVLSAGGSPAPLRFDSVPPKTGVVGTFYRYSIATSHGTDPVIDHLDPLPPALQLVDHGDGTATLSGTPETGGVFRIRLQAEEDSQTASQEFRLHIHDGGLGGVLIDDAFDLNSLSKWEHGSASTGTKNPYPTWRSSGLSDYDADGVVAIRGGHEGDDSTQSIIVYKTLAYPENLTDATLSTNGFHDLDRSSFAPVRAVIAYMEDDIEKWAVSEENLATTTGTDPTEPVPGSWAMSGLTWRAVDRDNLNQDMGVEIPAATALNAVTACGVGQLQKTGSWMSNHFFQMDSFRLESHRATLPEVPEFSGQPDVNAVAGQLYQEIITAEAEAGPPDLVAHSIPAWMTFTDNGDGTALLEGTPSNTDIGLASVDLEAISPDGGKSWSTFSLVVAAPAAPEFAGDANHAVETGAALDWSLRFHSRHGDYALQLLAGDLPAWLAFHDLGDGRGLLHGTAPGTPETINLTVTADDGRQDLEQNLTLTVEEPLPNQAPQAEIKVAPAIGKAPLEVFVSGMTSSDPDGSIDAYEWTFGDGNAASGGTVRHTFTEPGRYTVRLHVTDNEHATALAAVDVQVRDEDLLGPVIFFEDFRDGLPTDWSFRGEDAEGGTVTFGTASSGHSDFDTSGLDQPAVLRTYPDHVRDEKAFVEIVWKVFPETSLHGAVVTSEGPFTKDLSTSTDGFLVRYETGQGTRYAITSVNVASHDGTATGRQWEVDEFFWRALDWDNPFSGRGLPVSPQEVKARATGFGFFNTYESSWARNNGLQIASLALYAEPLPLPEITSAPEALEANADEMFEALFSASGNDTAALTWSAVESLPEWLTLENLGGGMMRLSGTPLDGDYGRQELSLQVFENGVGRAVYHHSMDVFAPDPGLSMAQAGPSEDPLLTWKMYSGMRYTLQESTDLAGWTDQSVHEGTTTESVTPPPADDPSAPRFYRLRMEVTE